MTMKRIAVLALVAALGSSASPESPRADDLAFQGDGKGLLLAKLIETAHEVTGEPFFFEPRDVQDQAVAFTGTVSVPRDHFLPFFDWCLRQADFVHIEQVAGGVTLHRIQKLGQQARGQQALKTMARTITLEELRASAERNTLITTTYVAKNLPVRELVTTLQLYFADSATESIRNVEGTNAIVMTGFASGVAGIVDLADRLDAATAQDPTFRERRSLEDRVKKLEEQFAKLQAPAPAPAGR
jgi:type II secretory pathway component GspD/PulD (secretin)